MLLVIPDMALALGLLVFAVRSGWFPTGGMASVDFEALSPFNKLRDLALHMILPVTALRSEEHTSELQSRGQIVCRLLLEKKNIRLHPAEGAARSQAQLHFRERSRQARKAAAELQAASGVKLIPIKARREQRKRA